jgi:hypothetical protein
MTLPANFGSVDYFLTFTTNPQWPEIVANSSIPNGMNSPDLYCRVFHIKMKALLADVLVQGVLGRVAAFAWSVEFQQRGLPHLHLVLIMEPADKPHSPEIVDRVVSAQLPDAELDPEYFKAVSGHMMHGPCGVHNPNHYCLCFAMTVHKSQGQTLDRVGIYFSRRAWTHGLLYVAVSRVRRAADCFFVGRDGDSVDNCCSKSVL